MDVIRMVGTIRFVVTAALVGVAAYLAPSIWETDRSLFGLASFDQLTFVLSLVLAYAALRVGDPSLRAKLALGVIAAFALATVVLLGFAIESLVLLALVLVFGYLEAPREETEAGAY